jgi:hypothetical protein
MSEFGGPEIGAPDEGGGGSTEQLSEEAAQRFAASAAAGKAAQKDERRARKRDDGVAQMILRFLSDKQRTHLATLISRLIARDCPSVFVLSVLSLINAECKTYVDDYLRDKHAKGELPPAESSPGTELLAQSNPEFVPWIERMEAVVSTDYDAILRSLMLDAVNLDGTILQLTSFVVQEFLHSTGKEAAFDKLQGLAAHILQALFQPYLEDLQNHLLAEQAAKDDDEDDE